ncbi:MAG TPA: hypothetical protein VH988_14350 [Thermoanaerobaculia bacterium]|jgi:hypothetical protein|nr:hypothetical protein [Thermoanaerobaculia bacterium]
MKTKEFDAVQFMRQARDKMTTEMAGMTFAEQRAYIEQHASKVRQNLEPRREAAAAGKH